jgi:hypothetical protein
MIKPEELRIGNLVSLRGEVVTVKGIGINSALHERGENPAWDLEGIILTEEWLVKFGLIDSNSNTNKKLSFKIQENEWDSTGDATFKYWSIFINGRIIDMYSLKYVHQLQNLYFALLGEELILNK